MKYIATFDIGTTAVKGVLMSRDGRCVTERSAPVETLFCGDLKEQRPSEWYASFCGISRSFFKEGFYPEEVSGIVLSGQMQDFIAIGTDFLPVCNAMLYSDGRAGLQAREIADKIDMDKIVNSTGNHLDGTMPFPKLLWLKQNMPSTYEGTHKILISSKDYINLRLTGEFATDVTSASTAGLMDIRSKRWNLDWMRKFGLDCEKLPAVRYSDEEVGKVTAAASAESGFAAGTPVYAGTGDAGATTLASGISRDGEFNINIGTSGWIACVSEDIMNNPYVFNLAAMPRNTYINVVPFLNAGNVHKWISRILSPDYTSSGGYDYIDRLLEQSEAGSHGLFFLPYLAGERFPVMDTEIRGCYAGITPETGRKDMARSVLEGVAFSIRQGLECIGRKPEKISLIGGGAKVGAWCRIFADVLGQPVYACKDSEYLPAAAIAASVLIAQGEIDCYASFINSMQNLYESNCYMPKTENVMLYNKIYSQYLRLYPSLKGFYDSNLQL